MSNAFSPVSLLAKVSRFAAVWLILAAGLYAFESRSQAQQAEATSPTDEPAPAPTAAEVQEKLRQWVHTQQLITEERADWQAQKQTLADLNNLRSREMTQLDELIAAAGERLSDAEARRAALDAEEQTLREKRGELKMVITGLENSALKLLPSLPRPVREQLGTTIERLEAKNDTAAEDGPALQDRYRDVLAVLTEAEAFDSRFSIDTELRDFDGQMVEVEIFYLGLARAYFTDRSGRYAGTGQPGDEGWTWTEQSELASEIRKTIDIFLKRANPELVELPLQLSVEK